LFTQLRQDITSRGQRIRHDIARTSSDIRHARDEYHLAKAERPRFVTRVGDLVARYHGVTLYRDRVERGRQAYSLVGVRATVSESADRRTDLGTVRDVCLTITGPDWEWTVPTQGPGVRGADQLPRGGTFRQRLAAGRRLADTRTGRPAVRPGGGRCGCASAGR
jgi:hypothetical protein